MTRAGDPGRTLLIGIFALLATWSGSVAAQAAPCRVVDPQINGTYVGQCDANGMAEGYGEAVGPDAEYKGAFKAGAKHGRGTMFWSANGDRYTGEFADDHRNGSGVYTFGPGSPGAGEQYSGQFVNDRREGQGTYRWPYGEEYTGPWKSDAMTGIPPPMQILRIKYRLALKDAVSKVGARVCRTETQGSAKHVFRGDVTSVDGETISVRLIDAPPISITGDGAVVSTGTTISDGFTRWLPCE